MQCEVRMKLYASHTFPQAHGDTAISLSFIPGDLELHPQSQPPLDFFVGGSSVMLVVLPALQLSRLPGSCFSQPLMIAQVDSKSPLTPLAPSVILHA